MEKFRLLVVGLFIVVVHTHSAGASEVNLIQPVLPPASLEAVVGKNGIKICEDGHVLQKDGQCCPEGTSNNLWSSVCTPFNIIEDQIFNYNDVARYCPSSDMFIVSDKNWKWFSCAASDSTVMYSAAKGTEGSKFCRDHGYGSLLKIKPWGTVGCIKIGDSQGDGCIETGKCSFDKNK
ncbi:hypothetical protein [Pelotalea chapellei]|uniref:Uncharacterized protein n=1 Tax=Pelotalea chapellei TaxID=44671 RepID=A0ABS5UA24_9BACT|nr:hypothetical protein [Pelotalea chapellei]MBT1072508.1 hypothetical protein [Pelotalea chapellei]